MNESSREQDVTYWLTHLASAPAFVNVPTDRRDAAPTQPFDVVPLHLTSAETAALRALGARAGGSPLVALIAAWQTLLFRYSLQPTIVTCTCVASTPDAEDSSASNTVAIRSALSSDVTVSGLLDAVGDDLRAAAAHAATPCQVIAAALAAAQPGRSTVAQSFVALYAAQGHELTPVAPPTAGYAGTGFDMILELRDPGDNYQGTLRFNPQMFSVATMTNLATHLSALIVAMNGEDAARIAELPMLSEAERRRVLRDWNDTAVAFPGERCLHELIEAQVAATPDAVALSYDTQSLTFAELNARSNQLARHLRDLGVSPESRVALCIERSLDMVIGLLAILKAGGAYVPLDPGYPQERLDFMVADSAPAALLVAGDLERRFSRLPETLQVLHLDAVEPPWRQHADSNLDVRELNLTSRNLAYMIYTSGSTGRPKGAMNEHRGIVNRLVWMQRRYGLQPDDVVLQKTPFSFDVSVWEFFLPLLAGARLVMARPGGHKDPAYLCDVIQRERVTTLHFVPPMLQVFLEHGDLSACGSLRRIICSGEALPLTTVKRTHAQLPHAELHNLYGPTEAAVDVTEWACLPETTQSRVPIGRPIANTQIYVLDSLLQPVPVGVAGEIHIGGVQVGRGYLNRPELTAERFIPDPFSQDPDGRLYKTGDLGRWLADGSVEYLGRNDFQIKIRGFRIELGEIEAQLQRCAGVGEAVVVARQDAADEPRLVAYYTGTPDADALRASLLTALPDYMVPSAFVRLEAMPLSPNGKTDRSALPSPSAADRVLHAPDLPQTAVEREIAALWATTLGVKQVGRHDHFFQLGGNSLGAIALAAQMRQFGLHVDVQTIFANPRLVDLALATGSSAEHELPEYVIPEGCDDIRPEMLPLVALTPEQISRIAMTVPGGAANIKDIYPLAPLQEGFLFHHMIEQEGDPYLLSTVYGFDSRDRLDAYLAAMQTVIDRHDIMRTAVVWKELPEAVQVVYREARLPVEEIALDRAAGDVVTQLRDRFDLRRYRMDVGTAPLVRLFVSHDAATGRWVMLQIFHHLAVDHTTMELVQEEVRAILEGRLADLQAPLPFRTFVALARSPLARDGQETFFRSMLSEVDEPTLPFDLADVHGDGSGIREATWEVETGLASRTRACARNLGVSAASLYHAAFALVLARVSGRDDVVFGTLLFGRMQGPEGIDRVLGPFINTLPFRVRLGGQSVKDCVVHTHAMLGELVRHEHAPLAMAQRCSGVAAPAPLFGAVLNYRYTGAHTTADLLHPVEGVEVLQPEFERTNYPLFLSVDDRGDGFTITAQMQSPIDPHRVCAFMQTALDGLVDTLERLPASLIARVEVLPADERHTLLAEWNNTASTYDRDALVQHAFEAQAGKTPERTAVRHEGETFTYAQLESRANRIAHALRARGVGRGQLVGLCLERGCDMLASVLGVLKAGAAYVPLDPMFPEERLRYMAQDAAITQLVSTSELAALLGTPRERQLLLDVDAASVTSEPETRVAASPSLDATPESPAYVIYTSGSTGKPKGVVVPHRAVVNFLTSMASRPGLTEDDVLVAVTTLSFDIAVLELQLPLTVGASVVIASRDVSNDGHALRALVEQSRATVMQATPVTWRLMLAAGWMPQSRFTALVGGEALPADLAEQLGAAGAELWNMYGPTETTVWSTCARVPQPADAITIGTPIANTTVHVLDAQRNLCPIGVAGELWIGGDGVALGYWSRPELTAERFMDDPFAAAPAMFYRTGDRGRWRADGLLEHQGRLDFQVKIRGYRIELGEIEAAIVKCPGVGEAVVMARQDGGEPRLVAYVVTPITFDDLAGVLRTHLRASLPDYMVPVHYVVLAALPLTANGKIDRRALPAPDLSAATRPAVAAPAQTPTEQNVARIWSDVLGLPAVDAGEAFFELGGDSLTAMQVIARIRQTFDVDVRLRDFFKSPTVAALASRIDAQREPASTAAPSARR